MKRAAVAALLYVLSASWFLGSDRAPGSSPPLGTTRPVPEKRKADAPRPWRAEHGDEHRDAGRSPAAPPGRAKAGDGA